MQKKMLHEAKAYPTPFPNLLVIKQFQIRLQAEKTVIFECKEMGI